jgi:transcriptional regulator with XRE-family HTH domain
MLDIGLRLKLFRVSAGFTQRGVAGALGVTHNFISMIERGKREPTVQFLKRFGQLVKVPLAVLLWEHGAQTDDADLQPLYGKISILIEEYASSLGVK